jgi:hypothetical protein
MPDRVKSLIDYDNAAIELTWRLWAEHCGADPYSDYSFNDGGRVEARSPMSVRVRLQETYLSRYHSNSPNLQGICVPAELDYVEHTLVLRWDSQDECESLAEGPKSSLWLDIVDCFMNGRTVSWDAPEITQEQITEAVAAIDYGELGDEVIDEWESVRGVNWNVYPARLRPYLEKVASQAELERKNA